MDQAVTADPVGAVQVRRRIKMYKALLGPESAVYGDHVELSAMTKVGNDWREHGDDFASTIGAGGVVGTKFVWPDPGPKFKDVNLTAAKEERWKKWIGLYNEKMLSKGEFRDLYVTGYDTPEGYAIAKDGKMYYAFFTSANWKGEIELRGLKPGKYRVSDYSEGKDLGTVDAAANGVAKLMAEFKDHLLLEVSRDVEIPMAIETVKLSVTVDGNVEQPISAEPEQRTQIERSTILNAPTTDDRADTLLPLIPGVVRGPDGLINMKGARSSQAGALVNSASVIDPVTGNPAMSLPIDVVESATVIANPYDPEYGRLTGAVSKIETTTSNFDNFHFSMQNLLPRPRNCDGDFIGIESATPRETITGPIVKDKVAFAESFEYRFVRTPVNSLPPLERDMKFEGLTFFSQVDVNLNSRQSMTATFSLYPQKLNYLGLNTFTPQPSTPDLHQRGYMASLQHRVTMGVFEGIAGTLSSQGKFDGKVDHIQAEGAVDVPDFHVSGSKRVVHLSNEFQALVDGTSMNGHSREDEE